MYKTLCFDAWKNKSEIEPIVSLFKRINTTTFNIKIKAEDIVLKQVSSLLK